jgi:DNA polymerase I-like protein with 3'-5' exonuclease and polymerase domains
VHADLASATEAIEQWRAASPKSIAIHVSASRPGTWSDSDDHRSGDVWAIALARDDEALVLCRDALQATAMLVDSLAQEHAPYVMVHGAQVTLGRLARAVDSVPSLRLGCTQIAAVLLSEGTRGADPPSLPDCVERVLAHALMMPRLIPEQEADGYRQCAAAASAVLALAGRMVPMLRRRELVASYRLECELVAAVVDMEFAGVPCDAAAFERIAASWRTERASTEAPDRIARLDKLISTYAHWPRDFVGGGRIHCRLHPLAADSGRFSCTDPNLQQVPSEHTAPGLRKTFRAAPPNVLVVADYAQIELRVAAHLAPCDALTEVFLQGRDPHRATAATLTGKPEIEVTSHERKLAKAVNFGFLFGMGADRFRDYARTGYGVEIDAAEARRAREAFFSTFPGIAAWHRRTADMCRRGGMVVVRTALGRRKRFEPDRISVPAALNIPVQGTAAEGFKRAMIRLQPELRALGGRGVLVVHDEYLAEVPQAVAELARERVAAVMQQAMAAVVTRVPIVAVARVVTSWGDED